jgi:hypothetical protein
MGDIFSELPLSGFHAFRVIYKLQKGKSVAHTASLLTCFPSFALLESDTTVLHEAFRSPPMAQIFLKLCTP